MTLKDAIQKIFTDAKDIAQLIASIAAVLGFLGLGIMSMGSSWPLVGIGSATVPKLLTRLF